MSNRLVHYGFKAVFLLLAARVIGATQTPSSDTPVTPAQLVGTWRFVSSIYSMKNGKVADPRVGPNGKGFLIYSADGHMCADLMNPDRPQWKHPSAPSLEEKASAVDGFIGYCGTWKLDAKQSVITHYPTVAWVPGFVGTTQSRPFRLEGDRLIFTPVTNNPTVAKVVLTWERVK